DMGEVVIDEQNVGQLAARQPPAQVGCCDNPSDPATYDNDTVHISCFSTSMYLPASGTPRWSVRCLEETLQVSIRRERAHRQDITVWRRDHADDALRSGPEHAGAEQRRSVRSSESRPLVEAMRPWLETQLGRISGPAASPTRSVTTLPLAGALSF